MAHELIAEVTAWLAHAQAVTPAERLILMLIADRAHRTTRQAWDSPSSPWDLAQLAGLTPDGLRRACLRLAKRGVPVRVGHAHRGRQQAYRLPVLPTSRSVDNPVDNPVDSLVIDRTGVLSMTSDRQYSSPESPDSSPESPDWSLGLTKKLENQPSRAQVPEPEPAPRRPVPERAAEINPTINPQPVRIVDPRSPEALTARWLPNTGTRLRTQGLAALTALTARGWTPNRLAEHLDDISLGPPMRVARMEWLLTQPVPGLRPDRTNRCPEHPSFTATHCGPCRSIRLAAQGPSLVAA